MMPGNSNKPYLFLIFLLKIDAKHNTHGCYACEKNKAIITISVGQWILLLHFYRNFYDE